MKLVLGVLCLALLLEVYSCNPLTEDTRKAVDLSSVCVHLTSHGNRDDKSPILLLHGLFAFKETWYPLMQLLAFQTGRKVCAADLRNHGDSPWSDEFDTAVMAKDVERLLETLSIEKVVILGHSLGGKTAVHFALSKPEKVEKLIVEDMRPNGVRNNPTIRNMQQFKDVAEAALKAIPEGATEREAKKAVYRFFVNLFQQMNETYELDETVVNHYPIKCSNGKCSWKPNMDVLTKAILNLNATIPNSHGHFNGPALFIYGGKSPFRVGDVKEEILELFPKAELVEIKNASHIINTFPEYKKEVLKFILK